MPNLKEPKPSKSLPKPLRALYYVSAILANYAALARFIQLHHFQAVLLGSYAEYFAPLWSRHLSKLAEAGVVFGAIVHDPVRDFVLGPSWWHRWSIACGYSFLREAFVHEAIELETGQPMLNLQTTVIPHGVYQFLAPTQTREAVRASLNLPAEAKVMLSFGHIRDGKNLDLVIQAMTQFPESIPSCCR